MSNKRGQTFRTKLDYPLVKAPARVETNGFSLFRPFPKGTAYPTQGQKSRFIPLTTLANKVAMLSSINLLNHLRRAFYDLLPANEPSPYYTVTSSDAKRSGKSILLGGRGLTYFYLTILLPFHILCKTLNY